MDNETKKIVGQLRRYRNVEAVIIFGSHAKNKAKPLSDVDIAVMLRNPDKKAESEVAGMSSRVFDVVNFHRLPLYIQFEVLKHGNPVFIRNKGRFSQVKREVLSSYLEMSHSYKRIGKVLLA